MNLHPDDLLFFNEVASAMRKVAKQYELPLGSVTHLPMPSAGLAECKGDCSHDGNIRLVLRFAEDGEWCENPRPPEGVWETAAHELAHLRHFNHGLAFQELRLELGLALKNRQENHRDKTLAKLVKMQAAREGEAALGNSEAAEAFATAINRMLIDHELNPSDIDYARGQDQDPVIEMLVDLGHYNIKEVRQRLAWQEMLARIVARAHLCTFLLRPGSNQIWFVGTRSHATVAEYVYGTLVPAADRMCQLEMYRYGAECFKRDGNWKGKNGFRESWLAAFLQRIEQRFNDARQAAVTVAPEGTGTALMRLEGALVKVRKYTEDKFKSKRRRAPLAGLSANHPEGIRRGRAAADRMVIGRRGVAARETRGLLKSSQ